MGFVRAKRLHGGAANLRSRPGDGGIDVALEHDLYLPQHETVRIGIGWAFQLEEGWHMLALAKSRHAGQLLVEAPLIDNIYRGEVHACLRNIGTPGKLVIEAGQGCMQLVPFFGGFISILEEDELSETVRGSGAFGSTG